MNEDTKRAINQSIISIVSFYGEISTRELVRIFYSTRGHNDLTKEVGMPIIHESAMSLLGQGYLKRARLQRVSIDKDICEYSGYQVECPQDLAELITGKEAYRLRREVSKQPEYIQARFYEVFTGK